MRPASPEFRIYRADNINAYSEGDSGATIFDHYTYQVQEKAQTLSDATQLAVLGEMGVVLMQRLLVLRQLRAYNRRVESLSWVVMSFDMGA